MNLNDITRKDISDVEILFSLQIKNLLPEVDEYLNKPEGKERAVSVAGYHSLFEWSMLPERKEERIRLQPLNEGEKRVFSVGEVYSAQIDQLTLKIAIVEGGIQNENEPTVLRACTFSDKIDQATNYDLVMSKEQLPFQSNVDQMLCVWNDFPLLSTRLISYEGRLSVFAHEVLIKLLNNHLAEELGREVKPLFTGILDWGHKLSVPITNQEDPRINFQSSEIERTQSFIRDLDRILYAGEEEREKFIDNDLVIESPGIPIIQLPRYEEGLPFEVYEYKWAADDKEQLERIREFWLNERKMRNSAVIFKDIPDLEIRINVIENVLYVMFFSERINSIEDIKIKQGDVLIPAKHSSLNLEEEKRAFTPFETNKLQSGKCTLKFTVHNNENNFEFTVE